MITVSLPSALAAIIEQHATDTFPEECCGLIVGTQQDDIIQCAEVYPGENVSTGDRTKTFEIDPKLRFDTMRACEAMKDGSEIVGHFHSHPNGPASPSATDLQMTYETDFIWIICGVSEKKEVEIAAFKPRSDRTAFDTVEIRSD